jgi:hypothetical protein
VAEIPAWPMERFTYRSKEIDVEIPADRLINDLTGVWPWPYSSEEIKAIGEMVPAEARQQCLEKIVGIGRRAVVALILRRDYPDAKPKPNLKAEIDRLTAAVVELTAAAESVSMDAWLLVAAKASPYGPFRSMATAMNAIYKLSANDIHSDDAPGATVGRSVSDLLGRVMLEIDDAFIAAHGGKRPRRRGPGFRIACLNPLGFCPAKGGFTEADTKGMLRNNLVTFFGASCSEL